MGSRRLRPQLAREGGHSRRRILHAGGAATGAAIARTLIGRVLADRRIRVVDHAAAIGLLSDGDGCAGGWILGRDELVPIHARMTLLATGGAWALYSRTTNPTGATGSFRIRIDDMLAHGDRVATSRQAEDGHS